MSGIIPKPYCNGILNTKYLVCNKIASFTFELCAAQMERSLTKVLLHNTIHCTAVNGHDVL